MRQIFYIYFIFAIGLSSCKLRMRSNDIENYLKMVNVNLQDSYKQLDSDWSASIGDMNLEFSLQISDNDFERIVTKIKSNDKFEISNRGMFSAGYNLKNEIAYRWKECYYYEIFIPDSTSGYEIYTVSVDTVNKTLNLRYIEE